MKSYYYPSTNTSSSFSSGPAVLPPPTRPTTAPSTRASISRFHPSSPATTTTHRRNKPSLLSGALPKSLGNSDDDDDNSLLHRPATDGFLDPATRWIGPGAVVSSSPPPPPPGRRRRLRQHHPPLPPPQLAAGNDATWRYYSSDKMLPIARTSDAKADHHVTSSNGVVADEPTAPLTTGQKVKRHLKKWWWAHLLAIAALVALVVLLIIFVAIPKIAQQRVDSAELSIEGISLAQTQADNYTLAINSTIHADSSIYAVIDPFEGNMYLEDWAPQTPFARLSFPQTTSAAVTAVNLTQFTEILNMTAFTVFNEWFVVNESLRVTVEGETQLQVSGISKKYPVNFKKTVSITALSNFNGTTVPDPSVNLTADSEGNNFFGHAIIPNRSPISFEVGNATFINYLLDEDVGRVHLDNMVLYPGNNNLSLKANVSTSPVLDAIQQRPYCETGMLPFKLQGEEVTNHGQVLSYYTTALASTNQSLEINVTQALVALGLNIGCSNTTAKRSADLLHLPKWLIL